MNKNIWTICAPLIVLLNLGACVPCNESDYSPGLAPLNSEKAIGEVLTFLDPPTLGSGDGFFVINVTWTQDDLGPDRFGHGTSCEDLVVHWDGKSPIYQTRLTEELAHCLTGDIGTCGESAHEDQEWWGEGGLVFQASLRLRKLAL